MLSLKQVQQVCNAPIGSCQYLGSASPGKGAGYVNVCTKLISQKDRFRYHVSSWAKGDNCPGYPLLLHTEQGFDKV